MVSDERGKLRSGEIVRIGSRAQILACSKPIQPIYGACVSILMRYPVRGLMFGQRYDESINKKIRNLKAPQQLQVSALFQSRARLAQTDDRLPKRVIRLLSRDKILTRNNYRLD